VLCCCEGTVEYLVRHLRSASVGVTAAAAALLALCVQLPSARADVASTPDGLSAVADLLLRPERPDLVANAALILGACPTGFSFTVR
jgi:hypothetical protein